MVNDELIIENEVLSVYCPLLTSHRSIELLQLKSATQRCWRANKCWLQKKN